MKAPTLRPQPLALAIAVAAGTLPLTSFAAAGKVHFAFGQVSAENTAGESRKLKRGHDLEPGDTIITERGRAQLRFTDGSFVSLQPRTSFKIEEYNYDNEDDGSERSFFNLFRGGLRTVTGAIGRRNRSAYRVTTPVATIGIRGTGYLIKLDDSGLIITVNLGSIAAINDGGTVILVNGQTGIIVDAQTAAQLVDQKPEVGPAPPSDVSDDPATDQSQQDDDNILAGFTDEAEDFTEMMIEEDEIIDQVFQLESGPGFAVAGTGPVFFDPVKRGISVSPFPTAVDQPLDAVFEDGVLVSFNGSAKGDLEAVGGSNESIGWVRWFNSTNGLAEFTIDGQLQTFTLQNQSVHGLAGKTISDGEMAMLSIDKPQVVFDTLAWTTPTSLLGELGSFDGATLELDLVKGLVAGTLDFSMFGFNYRMALNSLPSATGRSVRRPPRFLGGLVPTALAAVTAAPGDASGLITPGATHAGVAWSAVDEGVYFNTSGLDGFIFGTTTFFDPAGP